MLLKFLYVVCIFISLLTLGMTAMTEKQLKSGGKLFRNNCQPKYKITDEMIENMHRGVWDDDKIAKCYMNCILLLMKLVDKNGRFALDLALAQVSRLPPARIPPTESTIENCKTAGVDADDKCEASWQYAKCVYFDNPENYFLP